MKVSTNCDVCPFKNCCLMEGNPKRPLTSSTRQRPKAEKAIFRLYFITETGGKENVRN